MKRIILLLVIIGANFTISQAQVITSRFKPQTYQSYSSSESKMNSANNEITLFDSGGNAVAYVDLDDDLTIYTFKGKAVAYLHSSSGTYNIYGFNGTHLGWFENGIVRDHKGNVVGFIKGAVNIYTRYEPYKSYKQYKPYKSYKQYAPYKPYNTTQFSDESLLLFLSKGTQ
ncbi:MAG: 4-fold beta flower protein [Rikenellaceae bacterium]